MSIKVYEVTTKTYVCSEHGPIDAPICPRCDKCPHNKTLNEHCDKCNDFNWQHDPVTDAEFNDLYAQAHNWIMGPYRHSPYPRQYSVVNILLLVLAEYRKLRGSK